MALGHIGQTETVADEQEKSEARRACTRYYELCRDQVLRGFDWPFAKTYAYLADIGDPPRGWAYRYAYPTDCLLARHISNGSGVAPRADERIPFEVANSSTGNVILCNEYQAELVYTANVVETGRFDPMFTSALSYLLASKIAMPLSAKPALAQMMQQMFTAEMLAAKGAAYNEAQQQVDPIPEFIQARY